MRILHATDTYYPKIDGIAISLQNTAKFLCQQGDDVLIVAPSYEHNENPVPDAHIHRISSYALPTYKDLRIAMPKIKELNSLVDKYKPDIIHIHDPLPIGVVCTLLAKRKNIPIVNTYHTYIPDVLVYASPSKLMESIGFKTPASLDHWLQEVDQKLLPLKEKILKHPKKLSMDAVWKSTNVFYNASSVVIAPTNAIKIELEKHGVQVPIEIIPQGIDTSFFLPKKRYSKTPKFLHVGRLAFEKKVDVIIKAFILLQKTIPQASLTIIGDGPAGKELQYLAKDLHNIVFLGYKKREQLPHIYRQHDVFVTASEMETQGLVIYEAMACGLAVIGVDKLAVPDAIDDEQTGYIVAPNNPAAMYEKMKYLYEHPKLVKVMGSKGTKKMKSYSMHQSHNSLVHLYKKFI